MLKLFYYFTLIVKNSNSSYKLCVRNSSESSDLAIVNSHECVDTNSPIWEKVKVII